MITGRKYNRRRYFINSPLKKKIIAVPLIFIALLFLYLYTHTDKINYENYKSYEKDYILKSQKIIDTTNKYLSDYYENKVTKKQTISFLDKSSDSLEDLYNDFKWNKGDTITKELFSLRKAILINYSEVFGNKSKSLSGGIKYSEVSEIDFIATLVARYNDRDRYQKERFNLKF